MYAAWFGLKVLERISFGEKAGERGPVVGPIPAGATALDRLGWTAIGLRSAG